jgi:hypothetical protein
MRTKHLHKYDVVNGFNFAALPIKVEFVGRVADQEWPHFLWNVTLQHKGGFHSTQYKTGLGHVLTKQKWEEVVPTVPENATIMHSLLLDSDAGSMSFNDWCSDFGYDNDSIKAFKAYQSCCEIAAILNKLFTREQLAAMREALADF